MIKQVMCVNAVDPWFTENKIYDVFSCTKDDVVGMFIFDDESESPDVLMEKCCWALEKESAGLFVMSNEFVIVE